MLTPEQFEEQKKLLQKEKLQSLVKELDLEQFISRAVQNIEKALSRGETDSVSRIIGTTRQSVVEECFEYVGEKIDERLKPHGWKIRRIGFRDSDSGFFIGRWSSIYILVKPL